MTPAATQTKSRGFWWYAGVVVLVATVALASFVFYFGGYANLLSNIIGWFQSALFKESPQILKALEVQEVTA